jgi:secondary thiamine-phosphate synthase enzyme
MSIRFEIKTKGLNDVINITSEVEKAVGRAKIKDGLCLVSSPGSTCGITTIEYEPELLKDFKEFLDKFVPSDRNYRHDRVWGEKNGFSHILSAFIKPFLAISVENGKMILGTWQQIVFIDFDSRPRTREIVISLVENK